MGKCKKYILLKEIEDKDSLPIGTTIELCNDVCSLSDGGTIPIFRLIRHGYIELLEDGDTMKCGKKDFGEKLMQIIYASDVSLDQEDFIKKFLSSNGYL